MDVLPRAFFSRHTKDVAIDLLGKVLRHDTEEGVSAGKIVETEAYYGPSDPASRAANGKTKISKPMWAIPGTTLVYMVHSYWLFNIVTEEKGTPGAVLIRALEPLEGIPLMKRRRSRKDIQDLCSGPGKLTKALGITREDEGKDVTDPASDVIITEGRGEPVEVGWSHRVGVTEDLPEKLRFFVEDTPFLSR